MIKVILDSINVPNSPLLQAFAADYGYIDLTDFASFIESQYGFKLTKEDFDKDNQDQLQIWIKLFK